MRARLGKTIACIGAGLAMATCATTVAHAGAVKVMRFPTKDECVVMQASTGFSHKIISGCEQSVVAGGPGDWSFWYED